MKDLYIFPFGTKYIALEKYKDWFIGEGNVNPVCSPANKVISSLDNYSNVENHTIDEYDLSRSGDDVAVFLNNDYMECDLIYGAKLSKLFIENQIQLLCDFNQKNIKFSNYTNNSFLEKYVVNSFFSDTLQTSALPSIKELPARIIAVCSAGGFNNKNEVCFSIASALRKKGRKVGMIFTESVYKYFGCHYMRVENIILNGIEDAPFVIFNYVDELVRKHGYEDVIIYIPGEAIRFSGDVISDYGIYAYLLGQIFNFSKLICCCPVLNGSEQFYKQIAQYLQEKIGYEELYFHISNYVLDEDETKNYHSIQGYFINKKYYELILKNINSGHQLVYDLRKTDNIYDTIA